MYDNLIVPYDGSSAGRSVLGPAKDLAWRCGARTVIVSNSDASEKASRRALKRKAKSLSGTDTDFWIDHDRSLADAVLAAVEHRSNPLVCLSVRPRGSIVARRVMLDFAAARILVLSEVPVMVVGPEADVTMGLPMTELVVSLDGSPESEEVLALAGRWARELRMALIVLGVSRTPADRSRSERRYLEDRLALLPSGIVSSRAHLIEGDDPGSSICGFLQEHPGALMMMSTHGRSGVDDDPLGSVAQSVMLHASRPVVFQRPSIARGDEVIGEQAIDEQAIEEEPSTAPADPPPPPPPKREVWLDLPD